MPSVAERHNSRSGHESLGLSRFARAHDLRDMRRASPLEHVLTSAFLCAVQRERAVTAITTGAIPAAATTGMLVGFGIRLGVPSRVFDVIGATVLGTSASREYAPSVVLLGVALQLIAVLLCGVVYSWLAGEAPKHRAGWALAIGAAAVAMMFLFARAFAGTIALVLTPGNIIGIGAVIPFTLPIGMRFALSRL